MNQVILKPEQTKPGAVLKKRRILHFLLLLLFFPIIANAQVELKGKIMSGPTPVPFANIVLLSETGSLEAGTTSINDGAFLLSTKRGNYQIHISFMGFEDYRDTISLTSNLDLGAIQLQENTHNLEEVILVNKKKLIEKKPDRLIFHVENNIGISGGTAVDALQLTPGIRVQNNQISMIGKSGMRVMINDRIIPLEGEDLRTFLASLSGDDIKSIEVITTPPAKYQAEGNSGLLNIILKKGRENSWSNSVTGVYTQATYGIYSLRNTFRYNRNKVKFSLNLNGAIGNTKIVESGISSSDEGALDFVFLRKDKADNLSGRVALDYTIDEGTSIGFQYLGNLGNPDSKTTSTFNNYNAHQDKESVSVSDGFSDGNINSNAVNLHFFSKINSIKTLFSVDLDYFKMDSEEERSVLSRNYDAQDNFLEIGLSGLGLSNQGIQNYSAKIDVEHLIKDWQLSYGAKISFIENNSAINFYNTLESTPVLDLNQSHGFKYNEKIQAAYANASIPLGEKWQSQVGLRIENTISEGVSETLDEMNYNKYLNFFPTFYLTHDMNDSNTFSISYGRRINRPGFFLLNPFKIYISENSYSTGNPFLQPSFSDNFEFSHIFKNRLTSTLYFERRTNGFGAVPKIDLEQNQQIVTRENFYNQDTYGLVESYVFNQVPWWESVNAMYFYFSQVEYPKFQTEVENKNSWSYYFSSNNTFFLNQSRNLQAQVNFWYNSPYVYSLFDFGSESSLDIFFKYVLPESGLQISLGVNDIFKNSTGSYSTSSFGTEQVFQNDFSNRSARFSVTYTFGNKTVKVKERNFGNEEERGRAGN